MSAVSKKVIPASRAASTTALVAASSIRPPKLLQPRPTTVTWSSESPSRRVRTARAYRFGSRPPRREGQGAGGAERIAPHVVSAPPAAIAARPVLARAVARQAHGARRADHRADPGPRRPAAEQPRPAGARAGAAAGGGAGARAGRARPLRR